MADQSAVEAAIEAALIAAFYPTGAFPAASVIGAAVRIYRGWPVASPLNADMKAGVLNISIFPLPTSRNTTRWSPQSSAIMPGAATVTVSLSGLAVTFGGTVAAGQVIGVLCENFGYAYRVTGAEISVSVIVATFAATIPGASANGLVLTLPTSVQCAAMVVADATVSTEYGRISREFQISLWCPTPALRDAAGSVAMPALFNLPFLTLPNSESGRMRFVSDVTSDKIENSGDFRRDVRVSVDYPVSVTQVLPLMLFGIGNIVLASGTVIATFGVQLPPATILTDASGNILFDAAGNVLDNT